ncbi:MAG: ABC transporter ATP-binding protein [Alphaproteobacteria bacterium]|nr:ABC transporter ATP-binding protein [Alphaproteobacteria bacterium]
MTSAAAQDAAASIALRGVGHRFAGSAGAVEALRGIDLAVAPHEFVAVVGPSGCGKSTLMRIVAGLVRPSAGEAAIGGAPVDCPHPDVGIVFQRPVLLPWRSVAGNIAMQLEMRGIDARSEAGRISALVKLVGLEGFERALPHELSGGMQQRAALCRALVHDPAILLMDEPFGALDAMTREQMSLELQRIWLERRKTVLFITHSISEAVFLADRVAVMTPRPGRIAAVVPVALPRPRGFAVIEDRAFTAAVRAVRGHLDAAGMVE